MKQLQTINILLPENLKPVGSLRDYLDTGGFDGFKKAKSLSAVQLIEEVKRSGLRGRGGAGFPTGIKWETVYRDPCPTKYVVCNAAEGEPGTYKDRYLIRMNPYQLIEGILIACGVVEPPKAIIGIKKKFVREIESLRRAIREIEDAGIMPKDFIELFLGPDEYLFGEEKALLEAIDGRGALPRILPPYVLGIYESPGFPNPTIVNNVETFSHLPHIFANGAHWYYSTIGVEGSSGTMIFTLTGDVKKPGLYELPLGTPLRELLYDIGGGPRNGHSFKAVFSGAANPVITPEMFDTPMDFVALRKAGSGLGSAGFIVFDDRTCMVKAAALFSGFLAAGSCGQCVPCITGTNKITQLLEKIDRGKGEGDDIDAVLREAARTPEQSRCYLATQESVLVTSVVRKFRQEFEQHLGAKCPLPRTLVLPRLEI